MPNRLGAPQAGGGKSYGSKGQNVVDMNNAAIELGMDALQEMIVPDHWAMLEEEAQDGKLMPDLSAISCSR
jgi:pyruvate-ferredoxin/flavodoxin oxidoreductase